MRKVRSAGASGILALVAVLSSLPVCRADELTKLRLVLDYSIQGQQSPFVLAADGGYFARAGVDVQVDPGAGSADAIAKVAAGAYDVAFADLGAMIQFDGRHPDADLVSIFQVYDVAPMVVLTLKSSGITHPADLVGKRIASPPASSSRAMFPVFAAATNIDPDSIHWLDVAPQLREAMLVGKQADATVALITDLAGIERLHIARSDLTIMRYADNGADLYGHAIIVKASFATAHPDMLKKLLLGFVDALKESIKSPDLAISAIYKRDALVVESTERDRLRSVIDDAILTTHVRTAGLSSVDDSRLRKTIDAVLSTFKLPPLESSSIYRSDYLPPPSLLAVGDSRRP
jgi:NitT/TauT family transport system substrate-binding protein